MVQEIDPNHDGKITFDEFTAMMGVEGIDKRLEIKD
jgi:Ca2+-binding EF-hand superfamily protein